MQMNTLNLKFLAACFFVLLSGGLKCDSAKSAPNVKVYSARDRQIEEERIRKDIEEKLDWRNRTKETLDDYDDEHRLLYGTLNESILLRQSTGERFGIYESFDDAKNTKTYEIRFHRKNKITERFKSGVISCSDPAISADVVTKQFVLYREVCYRNNNPTHSLYLYDYPSHELYWLYSDEVTYSKKPSLTLTNGVYKLRWNVNVIGAKTNKVVIRNFKITKRDTGKWEAISLPPVNDEMDDITPVEKIYPLKPQYDLPAFVADWGK